MSEVTLLILGENLIVPIQTELDDNAALNLRDDILRKIETHSCKGLVIDVSAVTLIDTFLGRLLVETAAMARLMGCPSVLVGLRKEVVISILHLGLHLRGLNTALNLEDGLQRLASLKARTLRSEGEPT